MENPDYEKKVAKRKDDMYGARKWGASVVLLFGKFKQWINIFCMWTHYVL